MMILTLGRLGAAVGIAVIAAASASATMASGAYAGEIGQYAAEADVLLQQGKPQEALDAFDLATDAFWQASPLQFRTATLVEAAAAFGNYTPRADAAFRSGETAMVYLEPVGYGFIQDDASLSVAFTTGLEIRTPGGLILAKADDFGDLEWRGRTKTREFHATVAVALPDLKPGDYVVRLTLADRASAKSATVTMPFSIVK